MPKRKDPDVHPVQPEHAEVLITNKSLYHPPFRVRLPDGTLGPWYGPRSPAEYQRKLREFKERDMNPRDKTPRSHESRQDAAAMHRFVGVHSHALPRRELEVYFAIYVDGRSVPASARLLDLKRDTVKGLLGRLRRRLKEYEAEKVQL